VFGNFFLQHAPLPLVTLHALCSLQVFTDYRCIHSFVRAVHVTLCPLVCTYSPVWWNLEIVSTMCLYRYNYSYRHLDTCWIVHIIALISPSSQFREVY